MQNFLDIFDRYNPKEDVTRCPYGLGPTRDLLDDYVQAALNLYAIIPRDEMVEIFNHFEGAEMTNQLLYQLLLPRVLKNKRYFFYMDLLVHWDFSDQVDVIDHLASHLNHYERYVPKTKQEFLRYLDPDYTDNPYFDQLVDFFVDSFSFTTFWAEDLVIDIRYMVDNNYPPSEVMEELAINELTFASPDHIQEFFSLYTNFHNHQRSYGLKGNSPAGLSHKKG